MRYLFNFVAANFFKKESRSPRGFLPRPLLRAGESVAPPPLPQPRQWRGWASLCDGSAVALAGNEADFNAFGGD